MMCEREGLGGLDAKDDCGERWWNGAFNWVGGGRVDEHQYSMLYEIDWEHPIADRLGPFFFKTLRIDKGPFVFLEDNKVVKKKGH